MTNRFLVANQSLYGRAMDHVMKTFVSMEQVLSNVEIRGQNYPKPKVFLENPNSVVLLFQVHYKFDQRNPRARKLSTYISGKVSSFLESKQFREKVEREKRKILTGSKKKGHDGKNDDDDDEFDDNDDCVYRDSEGKLIPSSKHVQTAQSITYLKVPTTLTSCGVLIAKRNLNTLLTMRIENRQIVH